MDGPPHPTSTGIQSSLSPTLRPDPTTPALSDDLQWITAYLTIHSLSEPSWIYSYLLWLAIAIIFIVFSVFHVLHLRAGHFGAIWSKWAIRRRTWRKKYSLTRVAKDGRSYPPPAALPSNAQLLTLVVIVAGSLSLAYAGPDYLAPGSHLWDPTAPTGKRSGDLNAFSQYQPRYTINKSWWSSAARAGQIAFALFPLCVLLALKSPPFAVFSISFLTNLHFDKLAWLHRWCGILIWFLATLHVSLWSVQLASDRRVDTGRVAYVYAWQYDKFAFGWIAYVLLTLIVLCSLPPIRHHYYEGFYSLHVLLVPLMLVMSAIHHPTVWWWCWAALGLWVAERCYRSAWFVYNNGYLSLPRRPAVERPTKLKKRPSQRTVSSQKPSAAQSFPMHTLDVQRATPGPRSSSLFRYPTASSVNEIAMCAKPYTPPPGLAHVELLSGSTIRLRLVTPSFLTWAPGQHFLINIPAISRFTTHPFTVASVCDENSTSDGDRELLFLIRAKGGWTKDLKDLVSSLIAQGRKHPRGEIIPSHSLPEHGVLLRTLVDGPFGSAARADWGAYSSVMIVAGGSGVSFGISILEFLCLCLVGRDGRQLGGRSGGWGKPDFKTSRVRFVWLVKEFGHIQWCASALRRCMARVSPSQLQIDIFVTAARPALHRSVVLASPEDDVDSEAPGDVLAPPIPQFAKDQLASPRLSQSSASRNSRHSRNISIVSTDSEDSVGNDVDLSYYSSDIVDESRAEQGFEEHILDFTNFEGDDDSVLPGEDILNLSVRKEGRRRRSFARRSMAIPAEEEKLLLGQSDGPKVSHRDTFSAFPAAKGSRATMLGSVVEDTPVDHARFSPYGLTPPLNGVTSPLSVAPLLKSDPHIIATALSPNDITPSPQPEQTLTRSMTMRSQASQCSQMSSWSSHSLAALVSGASNIRLDVTDNELADISVVAERARPGKPKLEAILADEVERSKGAIVVGCCGPASLNAVVRKHIASQLNPERIRQGDLRGLITLVAEDFEY